ncbi:MAG: hypothetical protein ACM37U_13710 [Gemmatimonas sp.]
MPTRGLGVLPRISLRFRTACAAAVLTTLAPLTVTAAGQLIQIKTLPIADGDQWRIFPSANAGIAGVSIALDDSLLDPFVNPAKGSRITPARGGAFFGSPNFYSVSENAGGGRTIPLGGIARSGSTFAALTIAIQEIDAIRPSTGIPTPVFFPTDGVPATRSTAPSRQNKYAFASLGRVFSSAGISVAGSAQWSGLHDIDGVDLLYAGSTGIVQHGDALDARLGVTKEWSNGKSAGTRTLEAILLHDRFAMTHDVTWADQVWDPNTRFFTSRARVDHNLDRTDTWGLHVAYSRPLADSGWRVGGIVTGNLASHPKLPDYQISQVMVIPWDPGHSAAYDLGLGISKANGPTTFGVDAIFEPIVTHTWGEAHGPLQTQSGATIPDGGKTTENHFHFSNAILRTGVAHDLELGPDQQVRLQLGIALRSIDYTLDQLDHVSGVARSQDESWIEWTKTWGLSVHFSDLELRYTGRVVTGTGRPGILPSGVVFAVSDASGPNVIAAPNGALTLTGVAVTTHQVSISLPIR